MWPRSCIPAHHRCGAVARVCYAGALHEGRHGLIARVCYAGALKEGIENGRSLDLESRCGVVARVCCAGFLLANTRALPHRLRLRIRLKPRHFSKISCQVLQIRRFCRYAGFADMHVLQIRRFCLSRVPAFVPAFASAVIADADCVGVRR